MSASFFSNLFKKMPITVRTTIDDLPMLVEKEFLLQKNELEDFSAKQIAQLKYEHSRATGLLKVVDELELQSKQNERLNRAALTAKKAACYSAWQAS